MKQSQSNPLQRELSRTSATGLHPDADLLSAFAEGTLLERERQEVLTHLASCADCREVLSAAAAAAPASFAGTQAAPVRRRSWLRHPGLLWAGAAAVVVIAATAGIMYQQKAGLEKQTTVASNELVKQPAQAPAPVESVNGPAQSEKKNAERHDKAKEAPARLQARTPAPQAAMRAPVMQQSAKVEPSEGPEQQTADRLQNAQAVQSQGRSQQGSEGQLIAGAGKQSLNALKSEQETEAQSRSGQNQAAIAGSGAAFGSVEPSSAMAKAALADIPRPHWRINPAGQAERSFGEGNWQRVLPDEAAKMRVISVFDNDVWIGGEESRLYRSSDNGSTWRAVVLPVKDGRDHTLVHIGLAAPQRITVEAADGTTWTSADGGATWK
ncbi:MAG TPA: zf-HC2 domain-containing protein [Terracidiphilus sp.]|nr:zf-HC2 domain-containing protein [Terracidiphilus sp.]